MALSSTRAMRSFALTLSYLSLALLQEAPRIIGHHDYLLCRLLAFCTLRLAQAVLGVLGTIGVESHHFLRGVAFDTPLLGVAGEEIERWRKLIQ
jgi:hypothetical protein